MQLGNHLVRLPEITSLDLRSVGYLHLRSSWSILGCVGLELEASDKAKLMLGASSSVWKPRLGRLQLVCVWTAEDGSAGAYTKVVVEGTYSRVLMKLLTKARHS